MRKFIFLLTFFALVLVSCSAFAGTTEPFTDVGIKTRYSAIGAVYIKNNAVPDYGELSGYYSDFSIEGTLTENYSGDVPYGTITIVDASSDYPGYRTVLRPYKAQVNSNDKTVKYYNYNDDRVRGNKVLINFPTSPDIFVKSFVMPSQNDVSFDTAEIVPYLTFTEENV